MSNGITCRRCGSWLLSPRHKCQPLFRCRRAGGAEDWTVVSGPDPAGAAEGFAMWQGRSMTLDGMLVEVCSLGSTEILTFEIWPAGPHSCVAIPQMNCEPLYAPLRLVWSRQ